MKRASLYAILCMAFSSMTCQETKEDLTRPVSEKDLYKTIGEEIPFETGMSWIKYFQDHQPTQGRTELLSPFEVSDAQLSQVIQSTTDLVGIAFHYAIDESGTDHILVIPVDGSLSLWAGPEGRIIIDANSGEEINSVTASQWAQNFKTENPNRIWFHFFGKNIFDQMCALPYFNSVEIQPAVNILNLTPQLLLVVWNDALISLGRSQYPPGTVYDASNACPPCAVR